MGQYMSKKDKNLLEKIGLPTSIIVGCIIGGILLSTQLEVMQRNI